MDNKIKNTDSMDDEFIISHIMEKSKSYNSKIENRIKFGTLAEKYCKERLFLEPNRRALSKLKNENTILIQSSHGAQLPHLGICRLYIKGGDIARRIGNALSLFFIGDQYSSDMYPEVNKIRCLLHGKTKGIGIPIKKEDKYKPIYLLDPPDKEVIMKVKDKLFDFFISNLNDFIEAYNVNEKKIYKREAISYFKKNSEELVDIMNESSEMTSNYADWCARIQLVLLQRIVPELYEEFVVFYPTTWLRELQPDWSILSSMYKDINHFKNKISDEQKRNNETPYAKQPIIETESPLWHYCPICFRKIKGYISDNEGICYCRCEFCDHEFNPKITDSISPDIIFYQILVPMYLGINARIVGHIHNYSEVIDRFLKEKLNQIPPDRFVMSSHPVFYGVDAIEGDHRCSIIKAVIETELSDLKTGLISEWNENPKIYSYVYKMLKE